MLLSAVLPALFLPVRRQEHLSRNSGNPSPRSDCPTPYAAGSTPLAAGYQAFLDRRFPEAIKFWQGVVQQTAGTDLRARAMLAASLDGAGQPQSVDVLPYLPDLSDPYASVAFNQMRRLLKL